MNDIEVLFIIKAIMNVEFPSIKSSIDFEMGFSKEFFDSIVFNETSRAITAVGDPDHVIPRVDAGRILSRSVHVE